MPNIADPHKLILITNDDGIASSGLWAAVEAVAPLGQVVVVAPDRQWSGAGRSMPHNVTGKLTHRVKRVAGRDIDAYAVDASPALAVVHALTEILERQPDLVVSGINFGANLSIEVTVSGTVGAALEAAAAGIPALAASIEMDPRYHLSGDSATSYEAAIAHTRFVAQQMLSARLSADVHVLNLNVPSMALTDTQRRITHLSRNRYLIPTPPDRERGQGRPGYYVAMDPELAERESDIRAIMIDRVVSITPLSLDLTARGWAGLDTLWSDELDQPQCSLQAAVPVVS